MNSVFNITDFGASVDSQNNADAIQRAIDACCGCGGGTVVVPSGIFKTGTVWLKSHVNLHLSHGSVLLASENMDDYNDIDAYEQNFSYPDEEWVGKHLIIALAQTDVKVSGTGTVDGNGMAFYGEAEKRWRFLWADGIALSKDKKQFRPGQLICFVECTDVTLKDIKIRNATCWCCFFHGCENVFVRGLNIKNDRTYANTDGIDIDCCRFVTVSDCIIDTGDDAVAIRGNGQPLKTTKHGCEFVTVSNCVLGSSSAAFRIGVGDREIRHLQIENITVKRAATAFILMSNYFQGQFTPMSDISFRGISLCNTMRVFEILAVEKGPINDISFDGIYCETFGSSCIASCGGRYIDGIRLENFKIVVRDIGPLEPNDISERGAIALHLHHIKSGTLKNVCIVGTDDTEIAWEAPFGTENCDLCIENCNF